MSIGSGPVEGQAVGLAVVETRLEHVEADIKTLRERTHDIAQRAQHVAHLETCVHRIEEGQRMIESRVSDIERAFAELKGRLNALGALVVVAVPLFTVLLNWALRSFTQ